MEYLGSRGSDKSSMGSEGGKIYVHYVLMSVNFIPLRQNSINSAIAPPGIQGKNNSRHTKFFIHLLYFSVMKSCLHNYIIPLRALLTTNSYASSLIFVLCILFLHLCYSLLLALRKL